MAHTHLIVARDESIIIDSDAEASEAVLTLLQGGIRLDEIQVYSLTTLPVAVSSVKIGS